MTRDNSNHPWKRGGWSRRNLAPAQPPPLSGEIPAAMLDCFDDPDVEEFRRTAGYGSLGAGGGWRKPLPGAE